MYIKEVIIDGFKSYATRTVVSGFDPHFNAITGLNGSGKSNILDSICFVLGISNLNQVRVSNLQELVYKQGQAGVTKATVTIVFDNSDPHQSPVGYDQYEELTITRQVVIGGRNKYLINGHTAQVSQVQNLFHSVQLNVNNPHFLIMQGRITKVLNMKPPEILGMIEEAAGTRMYETKKKQAQSTMEKKQAKVDEIIKTMNEEISPTLERLRSQRSDYMKWSSNNTELKRYEKFNIAYQYMQSLEKLQQSESDVTTMRTTVANLEKEIGAKKTEMRTASEKVAVLTKKRNKEMEGAFSDMQALEDKQSIQLVEENAKWQNMKTRLEEEKKEMAALESQVVDCQNNVQKLKSSITTKIQQKEVLKVRAEEAKDHLEGLQRQLQGLAAGISDDSGKSLPETLLQMKSKLQETNTSTKQAEMTAKHLQKEVAEGKKQLKQISSERTKLDKEAAEASKALDKAVKALESVKVDEARLGSARQEAAIEEQKLRKLSDKAMNLEAELSAALRFDYKDPTKDFDRTKVKGLVASLIKVQDPATATALEIAAGGKLYQVVVDTESTGKLLLEKGQLRKRVTIIPLNRIQSNVLNENIVNNAKRIAGGGSKVNLALSLVGFSDDVEKAMSYVFGGTLVCADLDTARKVTFHKDVNAKSVTLDGDSFDPSGTLSGGSRSSGAAVLLQLDQLCNLKEEIGASKQRLVDLNNVIDSETEKLNERSKLQNLVELQKQQVDIIKQSIAESRYAQLNDKMQADIAALEVAEATVVSSKQLSSELKNSVEKLITEIDSFQNEREGKIAFIEKSIPTAKKSLTSAVNSLKVLDEEISTVEIEITSLELEVENVKEQQVTLAKKMDQTADVIETQRVEVAKRNIAFEETRKKLSAMKESFRSYDDEIKAAERISTDLNAEIEKNELETKRIQGQKNRLLQALNEAKESVESFVSKYDWIKAEEEYFGKPNSDYDFSARDPKQVSKRVAELTKEQVTLSKGINKKVMGMIEKAESDYNELTNKKRIIEKDKSQIERVISELDEKKNKVLETTWQKVTRDFGSIFSTLLPGTDAKLQPVDGRSIQEGLEVKVAFGGKYKESLTELSGGQRSLLALSLVLAMLLFKPAPMYILDEVDAALDMSHTQNIGLIIKKHFSASQFIVVSLKEGMFNNANVIFRTKFVEGVSTVSRTAVSHVKKGAASKASAEEVDEDEPLNKARKTSKKSTPFAKENIEV